VYLGANHCPPHPRQPVGQAVRTQLSIPGEHLQRLVASDGADIRHVKVRILEHAADGLVAEIVKMQSRDAGFIRHQNCATPGCAEMRLHAIEIRFGIGQAP